MHLLMALSGFSWIFFCFEILRQIQRKKSQFWHNFNKYLLDKCDERDNDNLIITHIYLILGVLIPLYYQKFYESEIYELNNLKQDNQQVQIQQILSPILGILALGIGDSFAALIGKKYGKFKIFQKKTLEGLLGFYGDQ
ncbi:hypothetical protein PPERSA_10230 [Pseudocohnilembus persalinus]|uniref:dolichol kinase n=1 Tax=Pseudocohnilembus persalinus TaxID=266149 RepID=A0A0V0QLP2_PSEPJ|nr:hypothetical protein PPERSA_10230 [Pseudocohnilembus persalinus]|eukprot:KRX03149.1 hypothetical protein PPERSA_10230 [Pseudocohnilembus persalinus]